MSDRLLNWARNFEFGAGRVHRPKSVAEVQEIVSRSSRVKAVGTRHSFNLVADTTGDLIIVEGLNRVLGLNRQEQTVTVEGGIRYGELCRFLDAEGFALHNLASLPHITVAGACATATHGSGASNGNLSTSVSGLQLVAAGGELVSFSKQASNCLHGAVVGLGGLGVVTEMTLDVVPSFEMTQHVFDRLPFSALQDHFDEIMASGYSVSLFTHWTSDFIDQVWVKKKVEESSIGSNLFGATAATTKRSPLPDGDVENCTEQLGQPGPWYDRLPHFRMGFTPSSGEELQTEYFVSRKDAWAALHEIDLMKTEIAPLLQTTEIRMIAADSLWMSPCYNRDSIAIHFTWKKNWVKVQELLPRIESRLQPFSLLPHWGKLFTLPPEQLQSRYSMLPQFKNLLGQLDPQRKFSNDFLASYLYN